MWETAKGAGAMSRLTRSTASRTEIGSLIPDSTSRMAATRARSSRRRRCNSAETAAASVGATIAPISSPRVQGVEKSSAAARSDETDRAQLRRLLDQLEADDVLMVTRLDRLARSTRDLLNTLAAITAKEAGFRSLGDTWADTTTSHGRLMLTVLGGLAEFERDLIRARTGEGRARAVARGQRMGRPPKLTAHQQKEAIKRRDRGEESLTEIGRSYNVSAATISRLQP